MQDTSARQPIVILSTYESIDIPADNEYTPGTKKKNLFAYFPLKKRGVRGPGTLENTMLDLSTMILDRYFAIIDGKTTAENLAFIYIANGSNEFLNLSIVFFANIIAKDISSFKSNGILRLAKSLVSKLSSTTDGDYLNEY